MPAITKIGRAALPSACAEYTTIAARWSRRGSPIVVLGERAARDLVAQQVGVAGVQQRDRVPARGRVDDDRGEAEHLLERAATRVDVLHADPRDERALDRERA